MLLVIIIFGVEGELGNSFVGWFEYIIRVCFFVIFDKYFIVNRNCEIRNVGGWGIIVKWILK